MTTLRDGGSWKTKGVRDKKKMMQEETKRKERQEKKEDQGVV